MTASVCDVFFRYGTDAYNTRRPDVRFAIHAASQLPGRGPTDVDVAPVPAC